MMPIAVLAVDPSSNVRHNGLAVFTIDGIGRSRYVWSGTLHDQEHPTDDLALAALEFVAAWTESQDGHSLRIVVEDQVGGRANPRSLIMVAQAAGIWRGVAASFRVPSHLLHVSTWHAVICPGKRRTAEIQPAVQLYARAVVEAEYSRRHGMDGEGQYLPKHDTTRGSRFKFSQHEADAICQGIAYCTILTRPPTA